MIMDEKIKYQIADGWNEKDVPIHWKKLPESALELISGSFYNDILSLTDEGTFERKSFIYFRKVSKFRKGIREFEDDNFIIGV